MRKEIKIERIVNMTQKPKGILKVIYQAEGSKNHFSCELQFISMDKRLKITKQTEHHFSQTTCPFCGNIAYYAPNGEGCRYLSKNKGIIEEQLTKLIMKHKDRLKFVTNGIRIR